MFLLIFSTKYYQSDLRDYDQSDKICKPYDYYEKDGDKFVSFLVHKSDYMCNECQKKIKFPDENF